MRRRAVLEPAFAKPFRRRIAGCGCIQLILLETAGLMHPNRSTRPRAFLRKINFHGRAAVERMKMFLPPAINHQHGRRSPVEDHRPGSAREGQ